MPQWLIDLFTSFQVESVFDYEDMDKAAKAGMHAAFWGNFEVEKVSKSVSKIGPRQVLGFRCTHPKALNEPSRRQKAKLRRFFRSLDFIWDGSMIVFDSKHGSGLTTHVTIGSYHQKD